MKKRCIDSAYKVIKVPKRPGQLVNEGRRKGHDGKSHSLTKTKATEKEKIGRAHV